MMQQHNAPTVDHEEVEKFSALADTWHDVNGPFRPLHIFNPSRVAYIKEMAAQYLTTSDASEHTPLKGVKLADIGCGGGLISAPMHRLGADVVAIDASEKNIGAASAYAKAHGLDIDYRATESGSLSRSMPEKFDIVLCLEVIEHVANPHILIDDIYKLVKPGGIVILATLNRTKTSYVKAIIGAEYILRWLPRGTHDWHKFITPYELSTMCESTGMAIEDVSGFSFNPFISTWKRGSDVSVNYAITAQKPCS